MFPSWIFFLVIMLRSMHAMYRSQFTLTSTGHSFQPKFKHQLLIETPAFTVSRCASFCTQLISCRTFDYDLSSSRCRLFEADSTMGTILPYASPASVVGSVEITRDLYTPTHNKPCAACAQSRYEMCSNETNTCDCPSRTYWHAKICRLQLFENDTCGRRPACRSDLNLTCSSNCYGEYQRCVPIPPSISECHSSFLFSSIRTIFR